MLLFQDLCRYNGGHREQAGEKAETVDSGHAEDWGDWRMQGSDPEAGSDLEAANGPCEVILKLSLCDPEVFCPRERSGSTFKLQFGKKPPGRSFSPGLEPVCRFWGEKFTAMDRKV